MRRGMFQPEREPRMPAGKLLALFLPVAMQLTSVAGARPAAGQVDFGTLLSDMVDRRKVAEFPSPEFLCKQCSSYNRESVTIELSPLVCCAFPPKEKMGSFS